MRMETVLISGGTGMIGRALTAELQRKGYEVIILTRGKAKKRGALRHAHWDPEKGLIDAEAIRAADHIVHLAGANVADGRWTAQRKREIVDSRVKSGSLLVQALEQYANRVQTVVSASAIGWYGPDPQVPNPHPFTEAAPAHTDFLGSTCRQWEAAISPAATGGRRLVILRTGIVLSRDGGAYEAFAKPLRFGLATVLGSGRQVVSWIHIDDLVRLYIAAIENRGWNGVYNAVAPAPVSNRQLMQSIAAQKGFHLTVPVPAAALKLVLGEMSIEVLKSATVSAARVESAGFYFLFPTIETATRKLAAS